MSPPAAATPAAAQPSFSAPVVDAAGVVPDGIERSLDAALEDYQLRSGRQVAVAVIRTTGNQSLEDYTIDLGGAWGVGTKGKDNGVLLLVATRDRRVRIEVGRGVEGRLTDLEAGRIIRERLVPLLAAGRYGAASSREPTRSAPRSATGASARSHPRRPSRWRTAPRAARHSSCPSSWSGCSSRRCSAGGGAVGVGAASARRSSGAAAAGAGSAAGSVVVAGSAGAAVVASGEGAQVAVGDRRRSRPPCEKAEHGTGLQITVYLGAVGRRRTCRRGAAVRCVRESRPAGGADPRCAERPARRDRRPRRPCDRVYDAACADVVDRMVECFRRGRHRARHRRRARPPGEGRRTRPPVSRRRTPRRARLRRRAIRLGSPGKKRSEVHSVGTDSSTHHGHPPSTPPGSLRRSTRTSCTSVRPQAGTS